MSDMRLVVAGAAGRMGRVLVEMIRQTPGAHLSGAIEQPESIAIGQDAGLLAGCGQMGVAISGDALAVIAGADGILDFTSPQSTVELAALAAQARIVHVIGTTGLNKDHLAKLEAAARHAIIVRSGNMSLGVNLLAALVKKAARTLGPEYDIEILAMRTGGEGGRFFSVRRQRMAAASHSKSILSARVTATQACAISAISALHRCAAER